MKARISVQETFLHLARRRAGIPGGLVSPEAWLVRVLVNIARNEWRKQRGRRRLESMHLHEATVAPAALPEAATVARRTIWQAMQQLPPRRRAVVILFELEGASVPQIAHSLGATRVTVRWHLAQGRKDLARIIGPNRS